MIAPDELSAIRAWDVADLRTVIKTYQRAHPDPAGVPVADIAFSSLVEMRVADILAQRFNAQLLASPLIPLAQQDMADRFDALWANVSVSGWTSITPPPVDGANIYIGDILETMDGGEDAPARLIVTATLPAGVDVAQGALGPMSQENVTIHILYVLPYNPSRERQIEALRGAQAAANLLRTYRQDPVTLWIDGKVTAISRNVPLLSGGSLRFVLGLVTFSCTAFLPYTPTTGQTP